jgi:hypothetical protein
MDNGSQERLQLERVKYGGYVVKTAYMGQMAAMEVFACTEIDDALKFIRAAIKPIGPSPGIEKIMDKLRDEK